MSLRPSSYRDPILVILEGDRCAPQKHGLKASSKPLGRKKDKKRTKTWTKSSESYQSNKNSISLVAFV